MIGLMMFVNFKLGDVVFRGMLIYLYVFVLHMVVKIIPVRLGEEELKQIDRLVEYGVFRSRSKSYKGIYKAWY